MREKCDKGSLFGLMAWLQALYLMFLLRLGGILQFRGGLCINGARQRRFLSTLPGACGRRGIEGFCRGCSIMAPQQVLFFIKEEIQWQFWALRGRVHLQQFGTIHLSNLDLTYIKNPEWNKIMFVPFHLLKTYIRSPSLFFIYFFTLPPTVKRQWQPRSARAYIRVGRWVLPSFYFCQVGLPNCWRPIFLVLPKLDGCRVDLSNCWSCS
jgi:hypothetical protein